jgi:hypothetical protein
VGSDGASLGACVNAFADLVGVGLGPTAWIQISQERIDALKKP